MTALWSDLALARAVVENAADSGTAAKPAQPRTPANDGATKQSVRHIPRRRLASLAL